MATNKEDIIELLRKIITRKGKGSGISEWFEEPYKEIEI
jgi:hypothetical protein